MKLLLIFNPNAGAGRAAKRLAGILEALSAFAEVDLVQTRHPGDATQKTAQADLQDYGGLVAAGGDGTLFEVVNGLYAHERVRRIPLGLIPAGTGNAFARDLGLLPGEWKRAVEIIKRGRVRRVDAGRVESPAGRFHFINIIGCGLPVDAMLTAAPLKLMGNAAYSVATLWHALRLKSHFFRLEFDGKPVEQESMFIEVSNTRYTGTTFLIAPDAELDDGYFDITLVRRMKRLRLLRLFPTIYKGEHVRFPEVSTFRAKEIHILAPPGMALAPDGELHGTVPVTIRCLHRDLQVFT